MVMIWIITILTIHFVVDRFLNYLNLRSMKPDLPASLKEIFSPVEYRKSQEYHRVHGRLDAITAAVMFVLTVGMFLFKGFGALDQLVRSVTENPIGMALLFFGILGVISEIIGLPFEWYSHFVIEKRYDFNRMTLKTFILDKLKSWMLTLIIGIPLFSLVIWFYIKTGTSFWWIAWLLITVVSLFFTFFYSTLIVPLFNKQEPLEPGELRDAIESMAAQSGFQLKRIYKINGSKRSTKANAYFTGFGRYRRVVLYDTLIDDLNKEQITAVLAHEIGHYKKHHILKGMAGSVLQTGLILFLFSLVINNPGLAHAAGATQPSFHIGAIVFAVLYSPVAWFTGWGVNLLSRKREYQADCYAQKSGFGRDLADALVRLSKKNLSNLTPHPAYVSVYYSHPPLLSRLENLKQTRIKHINK